MILTKTPVRIPLAGGGTDLPIFTKKHMGAVIPMAINQYIYTYILVDNKLYSWQLHL